jgi:hypothetical protein
MSVGAVQSSYIDAMLSRSLQAQGKVLLNLLTVEKSAFEAHSQPMKPVAGTSAVDVYA